jgi:ADP-ribose pyrophosphatase
LVARRRAVIVLFCSIYAFMSVYLDEIFKGVSPRAIEALGPAPLAVYMLFLAALGVICTLRLSRIHYGMTLNGCYCSAVEHGDIHHPDVEAAKTLNKRGVSTLHMLLAAFSASVAMAVAVALLGGRIEIAVIAGLLLFGGLWQFFRSQCHQRAVAKATRDLESWKSSLPAVQTRDRRRHDVLTLDMCQHDMLAIVSSIGLLLFSLLQTMSHFQPENVAAARAAAQDANHLALTENARRLSVVLYSMGVVIAAACGIGAYVRLRGAVARHSERLNQNDYRVHVATITDSFLGYLLLVTFTVLAVHASLITLTVDALGQPLSHWLLWIRICDVGVVAIAVMLYINMLQGEVNDTQASRPAVDVMCKGRHLSLVNSYGWEYASRNRATAVVAVVAVTQQREVVVVAQHRPAAKGEIIELPAGLAGDHADFAGESPEAAAKRELLEETGYQGGAWSQLGRCYSSPGLTDEAITFFLATGVELTGPGGGARGENIKVHRIPLDRIDAWVAEHSRDADMKLLAGLCLARNQLEALQRIERSE